MLPWIINWENSQNSYCVENFFNLVCGMWLFDKLIKLGIYLYLVFFFFFIWIYLYLVEDI